MPSKYRIILEMASQTARDIASNAARYTDFLITAANNYKYSFKEQLLIHAQKPDATACAEIDTWNKLGRWVNKGTKGIALLIDRDVPYKLRHIFDISDTNSRAGRNITLGQMKPEYEYAVSESLQASFGDVEEPRDFPHLLMDISGYAVEDNLSDYLMELNAVKAGSFLEELDDTSLEAWLKTTLKSSVAFMALSRAGYEPRQYFDREDFSHLFDFNTVEVISVLGAAVSDISEMVIREMGETVKEMEKEERRKIRTFAQEGASAYHKNRTENKERSNEHGTDLYDAGGLSDSRSDRAGEPEAWEVWNAAADIPPRAPGWDLHRDAAERNTEQSSGGSGPASQRDDGTPDPTDGREAVRDGAPESGRSDEMGADDEFHSSLGGGSDSERPDLRVTLPTVEQQQENIAEAEDEKSSAFSISQEDIDAILTRGSGIHQGKFRIYEQFLKQESPESNITFLKNEYGVGGAYPAVSGRNLDERHDAKGIKISRGRISRPDAELLLRWNKVEKRIGELIRADRYLSQTEKDNYPAYREQAEARRKRGEISEEFRSIVYDYNDFVTQLGEESKALNLYYLSSCWSAFSVGEKKMHARTAAGDFILPMMREAMNAIIADNTHLTARCEAMLEALNSDVAKSLEPTFDELNPPPEPQKEYRYHLGDTVYIGTQEYELLSFDEKKVVLFDTQFPLFNKELTREEFDNRLKENPLNDRLLQVVEELPVADNTKARISLDTGSNKVHWIYFNPDADAGGQYVSGDLDFSVFEELVEQYDIANHPENDADFRNDLEEMSDQFLADINTPFFMEAENDYEMDCDYVEFTPENLLKIHEDILSLEADREAARETDRYEAEFGADGTRVFRETEDLAEDDSEIESITDEERDALPISTVKDGEVVTYPNAEALLDDQEEALAPPLQVKRPSKIAPHVLHPEINTEYRTNFQIESDDIGVGTPLERFYHNIRAIQLLNKLDAENRLATPTEQRVLADYVGWGGLSEFFKEDNPHYAELKDVLSDEEYASARESTLTAFYTPPVVIKAVYSALENMHFQTGNVLEPSCGIGNFMGLVPESMNDAKFYGVELDNISGRIAQQLYQKNSIAVQGFENTNLPDSFFDAAIGNVPFGQFKVPDKRYDKHNFLIHDYFFARTLDKVRPGGVIAFITSKGTLDKENPNVRKYIAQRADLLGAIRLPNDTFKAAAGTEVTSDIIFLQKRDRVVDIEPDWVHLATDANGIRMNAYFVDNPEMVLGDMQMVSGPHGMESACIAYENAELGDLLRDAIQNIHAEITEFEIDDLEADDEDLSIPADPDVRNFSFTVVDGKIYYRENSRMNPVDVSATAESRIKGMIAIRDCVRTLIEYQTEDYPDADIKAEQEKLNRLYDDFGKKYGLISARANNSAFNSDSSYCLLASLEVLDDEGNFLRKADMFSKRTIKQKVTVQSVDTASEAYALSLAEKARIDMPYMSQLTGKTEQELFEDLKGVIFLNPMHISEEDGKPKYLPADEYLSGNVREKLRWAKQSAELYPEDYGENVRALEAVQPVDLTASEISVRLGATWLPPEIIEEFMFELFSTPRYCQWNIHKMVDSSVDNMLLITNDGRKLALDQRLMNDMLPDSETSKVGACAENVFDIWQRTADRKSTQMVFCDLSTPHGDGKFNVYDDLRNKLIAKGVPAEEIAYIHTANSEAQKKELFGKVRSGQVRVLIGSTQKMGAGTNVQTKLAALHHLDCPWRPSDLQQREGRIIRQGNENPEVDIYTYVTENTFDSYLYQLVESKQKFIGQIMTSKSPVRSAEDIDETALSYAEIKALCAGDPRIKEKMDLDIDVSRLKLLKANHLSQRYSLEDQILKEFPQKIKSLEQRIEGYRADIDQRKRNTEPNEDGFSPMFMPGGTVREKKAAGDAILGLCKSMTSPDPIPIGQYRGFDMELSFDTFSREYKITLIHQLRHTVTLGTDIFGNIQRLDNTLSSFEERMTACANQLENTRVQLENAKAEVQKPFPQEEELAAKTARLNELNALLNLDKKENEIVDGERGDEEPSRSSDDRER